MKWLLMFTVVIAAISICCIKRAKNNVCTSFEDYYTDRDNNENCYKNPDGELTVPEIVRRKGYPLEIHDVPTKDGYILTLFRIPHGKTSATNHSRIPIFLQHSVRSNSKCFVNTGHKSLGFILADQGYDVWLGNFRGSVYSRHHTHLNDQDEKFWDFSFHEYGVYDVAAQVDFVNKATQRKMVFVGYSMGGTAAIIYSSTFPDVARNKIKVFITLAPFIYTDGMNIFTRLGVKIWPLVAPIVQSVTNGQYFPKSFSYASRAVWKFICYPYPFQMKMCQLPDMMAFGINYDQVDPETLPVTLLDLIDTTSVKMMSHVAQLVTLQKFQQFDYGSAENMLVYNSLEPPSYDLSKLKVPTYIVRSDNDMLSPKEGVERFYATLPETVKSFGYYVVPHDKFNHLDFVWAKDVVSLLYNHLVKFLNEL